MTNPDGTATLSDDVFTLSTGRARYRFLWNNGHLIGRSLEDLCAGTRWDLTGTAPDCEFPDQPDEPADGTFQVLDCPATSTAPAHTRVEVRTRLKALHVKRVFRLYPNCPAIACDLHLRGHTESNWRAAPISTGALASIENAATAAQGKLKTTILHRICAPHHHLSLEAVEFFDITDRNNNLTDVRHLQPYRQETHLRGNLLFCRDRLEDRGLFLLKEAPCSEVQLAWPDCDFSARMNELQVVGIGLTPDDLDPEDWRPCYAVVVGVAKADELALLSALRDYQTRLRTDRPGRDHMIMLNTWGDRGEDKRMNESFVRDELRAGARLGVTHFQLDHGWETTQHVDRTWPLKLTAIWDTPHFWDVHAKRFPNGLRPCVEAAAEAGIELCLWFNPSADDSYAHWEDDADALIRHHNESGIRTFKIDGVQIPDKAAELNFRRFLDKVRAATRGEAVFNLDITAGQRFGYHTFTEYGNKFLENRYTDWSNYYPHWTLRNLWMLSRYVPPQWLQMEFLNKWRNADHYPADDPLAPHRVPFDYCFAITLAAQPLAWFEASQLPEEAFELAPLVHTYRQHQERLHDGQIFPIGSEPSGTGWTGFQSINGDHGYFIVYRELNDQPEADLPVWGLAGRKVSCRHLAGHGADLSVTVPETGRVRFALPAPFTFALYEYACSGEQAS